MNKKGFSLIELLVVIAIFIVVIGIPYKLFIQELKTTVREVSLSQTSIEHVPVLEIIRKDIETAGYGLPWDVSGITYNEASSSSPALYSFNQNEFNDASNSPPRAIIGKADTTNPKFSYLVLKSTAFGLNKASNHWSYIDDKGSLNIWPDNNTSKYNNFQSGDRVIEMDAGSRKIVKDNSATPVSFYFTVSKDAKPANGTNPVNYGLPSLPPSVYLIYGVDTGTPRAPFNRVDYYLHTPTTGFPEECAIGTHTLYRGIMNSSGNFSHPYYPLLHCVADFQLGFGLDTDGDGKINTWTQDITTLTTATDVRDQLKQVRVYILVQNGTKDKDYEYPHTILTVGETINGDTIGRDFDFTDASYGFTQTGANSYKHYRWKILKLVAVPKNLE